MVSNNLIGLAHPVASPMSDNFEWICVFASPRLARGMSGAGSDLGLKIGERFLGMIVNEVARMPVDFSRMDLKNVIAHVSE